MTDKNNAAGTGFTESEKKQFNENLVWAQSIVSNWSPQQRTYNSTGFPDQHPNSDSQGRKETR